jgi:UDP-3-O-[3-hydroxymyristoyl] glucosamine N-acyltransferase
MNDPEFFPARRALLISEIAQLSGAEAGAGFSHRQIDDIARLDRAGPRDVTYVPSKDASQLGATRAGACFVSKELASILPASVAALVVSDPYRAFVDTAHVLFGAARPSSLFEAQGRFASALVHPSARLEAGVTIDPGAMVGPRAEIGGGTFVGPMVVIGPDVRVGRDCVIGAGASLTHALVGDRVVIEVGARIGSVPVGGVKDLVAAGRVIIQDGVIVGANAVISRGLIDDTVIGEGARINTLVAIGSDVMVERHSVILRQRA